MQIVCQAGQTTGLGLGAMLNVCFKTAPTSVPNLKACSGDSHHSGLDSEVYLPSVSHAGLLQID